MALLDKNREPTRGELRFFGILLLAFGGLVGGLVQYSSGSWTAAVVIWSMSLRLCVTYYRVAALQPFMFRAWMAAFYPLGWLISHALLGTVYYLVITPIGIVMRVSGRDPLRREMDRAVTTYWTPFTPPEEAKRYFQQF